jgi:crotonobetainyl-CoA:carnitine CoA-transferase CaiB-like acyl-CoA transferase
MAKALGADTLVSDERFATAETRARNMEALVAALDETFQTRDAATWCHALRRQGIAASPIGNLEDLANDPQAWANDYFLKTHCDEVDREVTVRGMPVTFEKTPGVVNTLGPALGQDTELLLTEALGYSWDDVGELKEKGVIL